MMLVPAVDMQLRSMSKVKKTIAMTDSRMAVDRYIMSDWLFASFS
jgi:hypothetical protein